jgi:hypothetical protein
MVPHLPDPPLRDTSDSKTSSELKIDPLIQFRRQCGLSAVDLLFAKIMLLIGLAISVVCVYFLYVIRSAPWPVFGMLLSLTTLGIYLALAAHRKLQYHSHIYLVFYLAGLLRDFPPERRP